jgi:hypothetical protein
MGIDVTSINNYLIQMLVLYFIIIILVIASLVFSNIIKDNKRPIRDYNILLILVIVFIAIDIIGSIVFTVSYRGILEELYAQMPSNPNSMQYISPKMRAKNDYMKFLWEIVPIIIIHSIIYIFLIIKVINLRHNKIELVRINRELEYLSKH